MNTRIVTRRAASRQWAPRRRPGQLAPYLLGQRHRWRRLARRATSVDRDDSRRISEPIDDQGRAQLAKQRSMVRQSYRCRHDDRSAWILNMNPNEESDLDVDGILRDLDDYH